MLIIFGGLPGVGKSSIAKTLAKRIRAVYLRIDSIEQGIKNAAQFNTHNKIDVVAEGYMVAYLVAMDNLEIGLTVIADSVNPIELTRNDFRKIAKEANKAYFEVEIICSDKAKHQKRIETRKPALPGLILPTWQDVLDRDYEPWESKHLTIDTAFNTINESVDKIIAELSSEQNK